MLLLSLLCISLHPTIIPSHGISVLPVFHHPMTSPSLNVLPSLHVSILSVCHHPMAFPSSHLPPAPMTPTLNHPGVLQPLPLPDCVSLWGSCVSLWGGEQLRSAGCEVRGCAPSPPPRWVPLPCSQAVLLQLALLSPTSLQLHCSHIFHCSVFVLSRSGGVKGGGGGGR